MTPSAEDVLRFRSLVSKHLGLDFEDSRLDYLGEVLSQRLKHHAGAELDVYARSLSGGSRDELRALAEQLTVGETYFFRYWDHFRAFSELVLPELMRARGAGRKLRILSAGCASGEEAYSLAMLLREQVSDLDRWQVEILGVDINPAVVQKAKLGRYSQWSLRATPSHFAERYFHEERGTFVLDRRVLPAVTFEEGNLIEPGASFWHGERYDLVFCRNVLMYFAPELASEIVKRIARALRPNGFLFLGHAETLRGLSNDFHLCHTHDTFYYSVRSEAERASHASVALAPAPGYVPVALADDDDASWVEVIRNASERIASLTTPARAPARSAHSTSSVAPSQASQGALAQALAMLAEERFADALAVLHALPSAQRRDPEALLLRAVVLTNSGQLAEAERVCGELLQLDELNAGAHYLTALCREHAGDDAAALDHDRTAAYLEEGFAMPHVHMGLLAARAGKREQAQSALDKALRLLAREDASRILLFGGGFRREALVALCRAKLTQAGAGA